MVEAAVAAVSRFGAKALSLTAVARQAGIARATAYRMFGGRDALVAAIIEHEVASLRGLLREWSAAEPEVTGKIRAQVLGSLRYIREHEALQYMLRNEPEEIAHALVTTADAPGRTLIHQLVQESLPDMESGVAEQLYPDAASAAEFLVRVVYSYMLIPEGAMDDEQIADLVVRAIVR